jgi:hypothetical protein
MRHGAACCSGREQLDDHAAAASYPFGASPFQAATGAACHAWQAMLGEPLHGIWVLCLMQHPQHAFAEA